MSSTLPPPLRLRFHGTDAARLPDELTAPLPSVPSVAPYRSASKLPPELEAAPRKSRKKTA